jgi:hypothetical protein
VSPEIDSIVQETTALGGTLSVFREYAGKLTRHCDELIDRKFWDTAKSWLYFTVGTVLLIVGAASLMTINDYKSDGGPPLVAAVIGFGLVWLAFSSFLRSRQALAKLRNQIQNELVLCTRVVKLGSQVLEKTKISSLDAFALEIILFENEQAMNIAQGVLSGDARRKDTALDTQSGRTPPK